MNRPTNSKRCAFQLSEYGNLIKEHVKCIPFSLCPWGAMAIHCVRKGNIFSLFSYECALNCSSQNGYLMRRGILFLSFKTHLYYTFTFPFITLRLFYLLVSYVVTGSMLKPTYNPSCMYYKHLEWSRVQGLFCNNSHFVINTINSQWASYSEFHFL